MSNSFEEKKEKKSPAIITSNYIDSELMVELINFNGNPFFAIKKDNKIEYKKGFQNKDKLLYSVPVDPTGLVKNQSVLLANKLEPYESQSKLYEEILKIINKYIDIPPFWEKMIAHYVMMTWIYEAFSAVPYLRFIGEPASGKTTMLTIASYLSSRAIIATGATTVSPIFRMIEIFKGTLTIDEADYKDSNMAADIIKILNVGYTKAGGQVFRSEKIGNSYEPKAYDVFGPKILGNRSTFADQALETRCLTYEVPKKMKIRDDIKTQLPDEFFIETQILRNKLLQWKFDIFREIKRDEDSLRNLEPRFRQIATPIWSISIDEEFKKEFLTFLGEKDIERKSESDIALVVEAMHLMASRNGQLTRLKVSEVADEINELCIAEGKEKKFSPKQTGLLLRNLGYMPKKYGGHGSFFDTNKDKLKELVHSYVPHLENSN